MSLLPPLSGIRVLEIAGLAPGPFAGLLLADFGASVLRIDRVNPKANGSSTYSSKLPPPTSDTLVRHKSSIAVDFKCPAGIALIKSLTATADVLIDPFRPGVLEKLGLAPSVLRSINPRLIVARMTGYRRDGKYAQMAGHDINYIAVSGVLSMLGRKEEKPYSPGNIIGDFAGGGAICYMGILMALLAREKTGRGQIVEANMVDGSAYMATFPRLAMNSPMWSGERGTNILDGGAPFYNTYATKDGKFVSIGALEPQFFAALLKGLSLTSEDLPGPREDKATWPALEALFTKCFLSKTRMEWEAIFDGTDACVAPVLTQTELRKAGYDQRPVVTLRDTPSFAITRHTKGEKMVEQGHGSGVEGDGWTEHGLRPGAGGEELLRTWLGWERGQEYDVQDGGLILILKPPNAKL